jgi:hypothetical protein
MKPANNQKLTGGWKLIIASLSVTSIVGLINLFSTKDVKTVDSQAIDAILARPIPTLVPVAIDGNPVSASALAPTSALREVGQIASTPTPVKQTPVIQKVGGGGSSGSGSSTSTSSSRK